MIDPVLSGFDMPLLIDVPLTEEQVPHLDSILLTHCDNCGFWLDAPGWKEFNGNPEQLRGRVLNPERVIALNPGEAYRLTRLEDNRV